MSEYTPVIIALVMIVDVSRTMSTISQDAQMDFYEEFINNEVNNG